MKPIDDLLTALAREHLRIETLETRRSDSLDFHEVSVWGVKAALLAAYQAGQRAAHAPPAQAAAGLAALKQIRLALLHHRHWDRTMPGHLVGVAEGAIAEAEAAVSLPAETGAIVPPIVTVTVRGGLIEDIDATIPADVVVEDWDIEDFDTDKRPARNVWKLTGSLSAGKAARLRRLIAEA